MIRAPYGLAVATALALAALMINIASTRDMVWVPPDAADYGIVARSLLAGHGFTENVVPFHPAPFASVRHVPELHDLLQPLMLVPLFAIWGESPAVLRLPGLTFAALSGIIVFLWGRRLFGTAAGLLACLLTVTSVALAYFGALATDDAGFAFFLVATLAALDRALDTRRQHDLLLAGALGALTLLEKTSGIVLAGVLLAVPPFLPRPRTRALLLLWTPFLAALALCFLRNYLAHGSIHFRISSLVWHLRAYSFEGMMRVFAEPPELVETLRALGFDRVRALVAIELGKLAAALWPGTPWLLPNPFLALATPAFLPALGLLAIPVLAPWYARPAALTLLTLASATLLLGVLWHVELRFLSFLVPLSAVWIAGLVACVARLVPRSRHAWLPRLAAAGLGALLAAPGVWAFVAAQRTFRTFPDLSHCRPALAWLDAHTDQADRILSFDPWFASWHIGRDAIVLPSGRPAELATIARRYDAHWLIAWDMFGRPRTSRMVMSLGDHLDGIAVAKEFEDRLCKVYRLDW